MQILESLYFPYKSCCADSITRCFHRSEYIICPVTSLWIFFTLALAPWRISQKKWEISKLEEVIQQTCQSKEKGKPSQRSVKSDSANSKPTLPVFDVRDEQGDDAAIFERMAVIPVSRCSAVNFLVDSFERKKNDQNKCFLALPLPSFTVNNKTVSNLLSR